MVQRQSDPSLKCRLMAPWPGLCARGCDRRRQGTIIVVYRPQRPIPKASNASNAEVRCFDPITTYCALYLVFRHVRWTRPLIKPPSA